MFDYIRDMAAFDPGSFHFLRPGWLWALIPVVLVALLNLMTHREDGKWKHLISPALRPYMFSREKRSGFLLPLISFLLLMALGVLAMAGPTWSKEEVPGARSEAALLVAVDCSSSMLARDIQPNRLERAKFKIRDLMEANPGSRVGLHAFAGTAHTVIPLSRDYRIVRHHLEALSPAIMPLQGTNFEVMLALADSALMAVEAPSTLLLVTDELEREALPLLTSFVDRSAHSVQILALATPQGASIPRNEALDPLVDAKGQVVISRLRTEVLLEAQSHPKITVIPLTLDNSDMKALAKQVRASLDYQADEKESDERWKDMGFVLLILLLLILPLWFRKGWMLHYVSFPMFFLLTACTGVESWNDLWQSQDYQGQQLYDQEAYEEAGRTFESAAHQGMALFKAGNYDAAAQAFEKDSSSTSLYNLGLTYSRMGMYDEALEVIRLAAEQEPGNAQIQAAIRETTQNLRIVDSLRAAGQPIVLPERAEEEKQALEERRAKGKDEELSSDTEVEELPDDGKRVTDEVETEMRKAEELEEVPDDFELGSGEDPQNVLLRGISAEPSEFLRRRFLFQFKKYDMEQVERRDPW